MKKIILILVLVLTASLSHSADWVGIGVSDRNIYSYDRGFVKRIGAYQRMTTLEIVPIRDTSRTKFVVVEIDCKYEMVRARGTTLIDDKTGRKVQEENINPMWMDASDDIIIVKIVRSVCAAIPQ